MTSTPPRSKSGRLTKASLTVSFMVLITLVASPIASGAGGTFTDDDGNVHEGAIESIAREGITKGCAPSLYCPSDVVTREQMASFITRALDLAPLASGTFIDLVSNAHTGAVNALAAAGITFGCETDRFCPTDPVPREQMASFLARAFEISSPTSGYFTDVSPTNSHASDIDAIAAAGITVGCAQGLYCPRDLVRRDEMASFLSRSLDLDPVDPVVGSGEGLVLVAVNAKSEFDRYTKDPSVSQQQTMRALYETMIVRAPYFDSRTDWFPNAIAYIDLYAMYTDPDRDTRADTNPEWILRDGSGNPLYIDWGCSGGTCPQYAGDIGNPAFRHDFLQQVGQLVQTGYAGVMIDDVNMSWRISNGNGDTVTPIDPRTGQEMTLPNWRRYVAELTELVRSEFPTIKIMHNAIWYADTPNFSDPYINRQIAAADWIMLERGVNDEGLVGGFDSKWSIHTLFEYVDAAHGQGTGVLYLDETANTFSEQEYNLAAYFLTSNGNDLVSTEDYPVIAPDSIWAGYTTDLGDALGNRYQWNNVTRRDFTGGMVLLADPDTPTQTITLPAPYTALDGQTVTTVTLTNTTGVILRGG